MISGVLFFWISWIFWVIVTFLMKKSKQRTIYAMLILFTMFLANLFISVDQYTISIGFIFLLFTACMLLTQTAKSLYNLVSTFIIMISYTAILLWEIYSPIWLFLPRTIMIPLICTILITLLLKNIDHQIAAGIFSLCFGELLFHFILSNYHITLVLGELDYFDLLFITLFMVFSVHLINVVRVKANSLATPYESIENDQQGRVFKA